MNPGTTIPGVSAALLALVLLNACSTLPAELPNDLNAEITAPTHFAQAHGLPLATSIRQRWWDALEDPVLSTLIEQGLAANLDLQQAAERVKQSRALAELGSAALAPTGSVGLSSRNRQTAIAEAPGLPASALRIDTVGSGFDVSWEVDLFGRLRSQAASGKARAAASEADAAALRLAVAGEIAQVWFALSGAREQLSLARTLEESWGEALALIERQVAAGLTAPIDASRTRAELAAADALLPALEAETAAATHRLAVLLGTTPSLFSAPLQSHAQARQLQLQIPPPEQWIKQRPDLRAAELQLLAQSYDVSSIRAEFMPRLSLSGVLGYMAGSLAGLGSSGSASWLISPGLAVPVFDYARIAARVDAATARQREALLAYRQQLLLATEEVETALARVHYGQLQLAALQEQVSQARIAERVARVRYENGAADLMELLDALRVVNHSELTLVSAHTTQRQQIALLFRTLGTEAMQ